MERMGGIISSANMAARHAGIHRYYLRQLIAAMAADRLARRLSVRSTTIVSGALATRLSSA